MTCAPLLASTSETFANAAHPSLHLIDGADDSPTWQLKKSSQASGYLPRCLPRDLVAVETIDLDWRLWLCHLPKAARPAARILILIRDSKHEPLAAHWEVIDF